MYAANIKTLSGFFNGFTGRTSGGAVAAIDEDGNFGFLPDCDDKPYTPMGGRKTLVLVKDLLVFRPYNWGKGSTVSRGRRL